jgi:hypothetical protein
MPGRVSIIVEQLLDLALLHRPLAAGAEVGPDIPPLAQIAPQQFGRVPPQGLLAAESVLQAPDRKPMVPKVHIVDGEHERFAHAEAVVVDEPKEGLVAGRCDGREEAFQLVLGEVFG